MVDTGSLQRPKTADPSVRLPGGPKGKWRSTLKIIRDPRATFQHWVEEYGDPFYVHALNGPIVLTGREDLIRTIFGADPEIYTLFAADTLRPMLGSGSMILKEGIPHKMERKLVMPMFHGDRMKAYAGSMKQVAIEELEKRAAESPLMILPMMTDISLGIIVRTIFGGEGQQRFERLKRAGREIIRRSNPLLFFSKKMHFHLLGLSPWDRFVKARTEIDSAMDAELERRISERERGDDILAMLMGAKYEDGAPISREHVRDELLTFLFAGHETSALAMTWAMVHLHQHPDSLARVHEELRGTDPENFVELTQLPYLKAVVQETLRLNPIVTEVLRVLREPMELGEYRLPAGMAVAPAAVIAHYNPENYPEPEAFRPERFLEKSYTPFQYMPFGGGHRRCIGAAFATFEMAIVLGTLLRDYRFELLEHLPIRSVRRNLTMGPSSPVRMSVSKVRE